MSQSQLEHVLQPLALNFDPPSDKAMRVELSERQLVLLGVAGLNAIVAAQRDGGPPSHAVPSSTNVTATGAVLVTASAAGRFVEVTNNGDKSVLILAGGTPAWAGGDVAVAYGYELGPGDYWCSPTRITSAVNAVTKVSEQTAVTVTVYA